MFWIIFLGYAVFLTHRYPCTFELQALFPALDILILNGLLNLGRVGVKNGNLGLFLKDL